VISGNSKSFYPPRVIDYCFDQVVFDVSGSLGAYLYFGDAYDPYWRAYLDGQRVPIYRANYLFRAVFVPQGSQKLIFKFQPVSTGLLFLTPLALIFYAVCGLFSLGKFLRKR
jgi:uncharacterized membrane protein YfhO